MTEKTLIPLDGSATAEKALRYAEELIAKLHPQEKPEVFLLKAVTPHIDHINVEGGTVDLPDTKPEDYAEEAERSRNYLEQAAAGLRNDGITVNCIVSLPQDSETASDVIIQQEKQTGADLVIMATHGHSNLERLAFGSVADKVLRNGSVPVLMVRAR